MTMLNDKRLELLVQQEQERISESQPREIDLSIIQARCLCWLVRLAESHEDQAIAAEKSRDTEQAMGWYADAQRVKDVINLITSIEIPNVNDHYSSEIEQEDEEFLLTSEPQENDIIYETIDYTLKGLKNGHKRSQVENLQTQKKIDTLSDKSSKIEDLIKITNTKFIIVTHHALTMSRMHRLYGITMPEKGISQLVAVDLERAEELVA